MEACASIEAAAMSLCKALDTQLTDEIEDPHAVFQDDMALVGEKEVAGDDQEESLGMHSAEEVPLAVSTVDIKRLMKIKAEQELRLGMLHARVDRLTEQERQVWKQVTRTQQSSQYRQQLQWRQQTQKAEQMRLEREVMAQEQMLRERAREMRFRAMETKDAPRLAKFEENKALGKQVREDSKRLMAALNDYREQTVQFKARQVEARRQQRRQQKLRTELRMTRREQARQDKNAEKYADLQDEIRNAEHAIAAAEHEELSAVKRLQNSQSVHAEVLSQLRDIEAVVPVTPRSPSGSPGQSYEAQMQSSRSGGVLPNPHLGQVTEGRMTPTYMQPSASSPQVGGSSLTASSGKRSSGSASPRPVPFSNGTGTSARAPPRPAPVNPGTNAAAAAAASAAAAAAAAASARARIPVRPPDV